MGNLTAAIRENLMVSDKEYQRLYDEHERYDHELMELESKRFLTENDQVEEVRLKKLKLRAKDRMEELVQRAKSA
ncbi:MAG TPA: YdcH family protein [Terriglobia bacterium]|nr:YdcH family protein [Terriglobia bacterium]